MTQIGLVVHADYLTDGKKLFLYNNTKKSSVKREKRNRKRKKKENFVFLVLVLRLCQKSSSVKRQNVSAIVSARYEPPCLRRLCSSVKVLALAIAIALVLTLLV